MIDQWKAELQKYGFEYKKWTSSEKAFVRLVGNVEQQIWESSIRQRPNEPIINTYISIMDPFGADNEFRVVLNGRLATNGIIIPRSDTGVGKFWKQDESSEALELLVKVALPWFEDNSRLEILIEYVTNDVVIRPISTEQTASCTWFFKNLIMAKLQNNNKEVEIKTRPINHLKLSLLYYHTGKNDLACLNAKEWLKHCSNLPGEPDRTLRQLREMGCPE